MWSMNKNIHQIINTIGLNDDFIKSVQVKSIRTSYTAVFNWLSLAGMENGSKDNPTLNSSQLDYIVEAIYHLYQLQEYTFISCILTANITTNDSSTIVLYKYLLRQGKGEKTFDIINMVLNKIKKPRDEIYLFKIIKAQAAESFGNRVLAKHIYEEICENEPPHSKNHIEGLASLARCEIQMGQYKLGVPRLEYIRELTSILDSSGSDLFLNKIKSNSTEDLAFYQMNNGLFREAFDLFGEVFYYRENNEDTTGLVSPLGHQGIILRKNAVSKAQLVKILIVNISRLLKLSKLSNLLERKLCYPSRNIIEQNYKKSEDLLQKAFDICNKNDDENAKAWVSHHLSWVFLNSKKSQAEELSLISIKQYEINGDQRGISDCHEQLGRIYLTRNSLNIQKAEFHLNQSFNIRHKINNLHGLASSILSLSFLYWHQKQHRKSLLFMTKSAKAYQQIGMLNLVRILAILTLFSVWTVGDRDWTA
jgi:hypothetical protein